MSKRTLALILAFAVLFTACDNITDKTKKALNKTGEAIGEGGSEFAKGISKGVDNTMDGSVVLGDALKAKGVSFGKFMITSDSASSKKNKLSVYLIFDKDLTTTLSAKIFDQKNTEYGRATTTMTAKTGEAKYATFVFDIPADIESKSKFVIE